MAREVACPSSEWHRVQQRANLSHDQRQPKELVVVHTDQFHVRPDDETVARTFIVMLLGDVVILDTVDVATRPRKHFIARCMEFDELCTTAHCSRSKSISISGILSQLLEFPLELPPFPPPPPPPVPPPSLDLASCFTITSLPISPLTAFTPGPPSSTPLD
uniref:Uncharacterized protein n=1 Tax=Phlebotomus papatasi TaxID=29031 RepID=A0A1B0DCD7_PHLPP